MDEAHSYLDDIAKQRDAALTRADTAEARVKVTEQALFDCIKLSGADTDGATGPDDLGQDVAERAVEEAKRSQHDYDEALGEIAQAEAERDEALATSNELVDHAVEAAETIVHAEIERRAGPLLTENERLREALTFADFARVNKARCEAVDGFGHALGAWSTSDWFLAAIGELGEAANKAKKLNRVRDGIPGNTETTGELISGLAEELADTVIYLDLLTQSLGFDLGEIVTAKFNAKSDEMGFSYKLAAPEDR
mgnify:CR=1 FL=1